MMLAILLFSFGLVYETNKKHIHEMFEEDQRWDGASM